MLTFAASLASIRRKLREHLGWSGLPRNKVLATVVNPLETTLIRVGRDEYAKQNKSYGLTTLKNGCGGPRQRAALQLQGKKWQSLAAWDLRPAHSQGDPCLSGATQELFQYLDEQGQTRNVTSSDVNAYLKEISGRDITAKDFRTWHGTVLAALALQELEKVDSPAGAKKNIKVAIQRVAGRPGDTPTICRKCYIHPEILHSYIEGSFELDAKAKVETELGDDLHGLKPEKAAVLGLLESRLGRTLKDKLRQSVARAA
jgi:DNA topoisomerase-1